MIKGKLAGKKPHSETELASVWVIRSASCGSAAYQPSPEAETRGTNLRYILKSGVGRWVVILKFIKLRVLR